MDRPLERSELISIAAKDEEYYSKWVGNDIQELAQRYLGVRAWIKYRDAITVLSRFGYFFSSNPTPGEEFAQAEATGFSTLRRFISILLNNELNLPKEIPKHYIEIVHDIHVITFLLFGDFYELPKRITNYFYQTRAGETQVHQSNKMSYLYRMIAFMSITRLSLNISKRLESNQQKASSTPSTREKSIHPGNSSSDASASGGNSRQQEDSSSPGKSRICHLCSEPRIDPTSTICGHIFCWQCIHKWLRERSECPICRTPTEPSRLIYLINYR